MKSFHLLLLSLLCNTSIVCGGPGQVMNVDVRAGEERCIGQELDQEDIAFFTMSASAKPTNEEDKHGFANRMEQIRDVRNIT